MSDGTFLDIFRQKQNIEGAPAFCLPVQGFLWSSKPPPVCRDETPKFAGAMVDSPGSSGCWGAENCHQFNNRQTTLTRSGLFHHLNTASAVKARCVFIQVIMKLLLSECTTKTKHVNILLYKTLQQFRQTKTSLKHIGLFDLLISKGYN